MSITSFVRDYFSSLSALANRASAAEIAAGVVPVNYEHPPGAVDRYGTNSVPGTTDMTAAFQAAINSVATSGGTVTFGESTYLILGQIQFSTSRSQRVAAMRIVGAGADNYGSLTGNTPVGGTILNMQYASGPKISTLGNGQVEIEGINFSDSGTDTQPFFYTEQTTLRVHDCSFWGTTARNDAFVFGGTTTATSFQGYGTSITQNNFHYISRLAYFQTYADAIVIRDNNVWNTCGGACCIEMNGYSSSCSGNVVCGNLIETVNYPIAVKLTANAVNNYFAGNGIWDAPSAGVTAYYCGTGSTGNIFIESFADAYVTFVDETGSGLGVNTYFRTQQNGESSTGSQLWRFFKSPYAENGLSAQYMNYGSATDPYTFSQWQSVTISGNHYFELNFRDGASNPPYLPLQLISYSVSGAEIRLSFPSATVELLLSAPAGANFYLEGDTIWFRSAAATGASYHAGGQFHGAAAMYPASAVTGAVQTASGLWMGSGAPSATYGNQGDFYLNGAGAAGSYLYVRGASAWTAIL